MSQPEQTSPARNEAGEVNSRNAQVAEPFRCILNGISPLVKGSLRFELVPDDDGLENNTKEKN